MCRMERAGKSVNNDEVHDVNVFDAIPTASFNGILPERKTTAFTPR